MFGIDSSPCSLSLRNRSTLCSTTKCHQNKSDLKNVFVQKSFLFNIYSFNPSHAYWNQRRLYSDNLPYMFIFVKIFNSTTVRITTIYSLLTVYLDVSKIIPDAVRSLDEVKFVPQHSKNYFVKLLNERWVEFVLGQFGLRSPLLNWSIIC